MRFRGKDYESQIQPGLTARLRPVLVAHQTLSQEEEMRMVKEEEEGRQEIIKRQWSSRRRRRKWKRNGEDYCS